MYGSHEKHWICGQQKFSKPEQWKHLIKFNLIQLNSCLVTCWVNNQSASNKQRSIQIQITEDNKQATYDTKKKQPPEHVKNLSDIFWYENENDVLLSVINLLCEDVKVTAKFRSDTPGWRTVLKTVLTWNNNNANSNNSVFY